MPAISSTRSNCGEALLMTSPPATADARARARNNAPNPLESQKLTSEASTTRCTYPRSTRLDSFRSTTSPVTRFNSPDTATCAVYPSACTTSTGFTRPRYPLVDGPSPETVGDKPPVTSTAHPWCEARQRRRGHNGDMSEPIDAEIVPDDKKELAKSLDEPLPVVGPIDYSDDGVPTFDYVRDRIENRVATSAGTQELTGASPQAKS